MFKPYQVLIETSDQLRRSPSYRESPGQAASPLHSENGTREVFLYVKSKIVCDALDPGACPAPPPPTKLSDIAQARDKSNSCGSSSLNDSDLSTYILDQDSLPELHDAPRASDAGDGAAHRGSPGLMMSPFPTPPSLKRCACHQMLTTYARISIYITRRVCLISWPATSCRCVR